MKDVVCNIVIERDFTVTDIKQRMKEKNIDKGKQNDPYNNMMIKLITQNQNEFEYDLHFTNCCVHCKKTQTISANSTNFLISNEH